MAKRGGGATRARGRSGSRSSRRGPADTAAGVNPPPAGGNAASHSRRNPDDHDHDHDRRCALCRREVDRTTVHHLVPRARGGNHGPKANLCPTCHQQLHAMFSVSTLADELHSVELLRAHPRVAGFLRWMSKQRGASFPVRRAKNRE